MADVAIPPEHWRELRRSANCFIPKLILASAATSAGFSNTALYRAGQQKGLSKFSLHIVGNVLSRKAVTHEKAEQFLEAYAAMAPEILKAHGPIGDGDIVAAFFGIPGLSDLMKEARLSEEELAAASGVSLFAVKHVLRSRRATGGIALALHSALVSNGAKCPPLTEFAASSHLEGVAKKAVEGIPFSLNDLLLPLPNPSPDPWS
jgi:hypothetical protein